MPSDRVDSLFSSPLFGRVVRDEECALVDERVFKVEEKIIDLLTVWDDLEPVQRRCRERVAMHILDHSGDLFGLWATGLKR